MSGDKTRILYNALHDEWKVDICSIPTSEVQICKESRGGDGDGETGLKEWLRGCHAPDTSGEWEGEEGLEANTDKKGAYHYRMMAAMQSVVV
jgi:hypothetical protein